ncbi:hypothetical protein SAMN02910369_00077 [Lachnospiraceae bacterium NE2001]|nr:hypothetical protein SAMN02910369_00077 [Lachnospiraceae bacterium NE2001]
MKNKYDVITETIDEMVTYFSRLYSEHDTNLQGYKAKLFELNVRLDELSRTQNVYALNTDYRKSVFSPISLQPEENEREREIRKEIEKLQADRDKFEYKVNEETIYLKGIDKRLKNLNSSKTELSTLMMDYGRKEEEIRQKDKEIKEQTEKEIKLKDENKHTQIEEANLKKHLKNILMLSTFDDTYYSTVLDKRIKMVLVENNKKLENVRGYIYSSPGRSKVLLDELSASQKNMTLIIDDQLDRLNYNFDDEQPLKDMLKDYIDDMQEKHPDIPIESKIDTGMNKPGFDRYVVLKKLLNVFFDNIYKHSKAKKIEFSANENDNLFTFELYDNGIGLKDDYMKGKEWYTGINRAKELIFIVNGTLKIDGSKGTRITFTFKNE